MSDVIQPETDQDQPAVRHVNREAFGGDAEAWMALELVPGVLEGVEGRVEYSPPFKALE